MAPPMPYSGSSRKLLLAFDVGTTFSGVAYSVLDPGEVPTIQAVTRYPGGTNSDFKIPSVIVYTQDGQVRAAGAEAKDPGMDIAIDEENLVLVEWFKLHLLPASMESGVSFKDLDVSHRLPSKKTAVQVFSDFLAYLFKCTKEYIIEARANGASLWDSVQDSVEVVLTHPNGWEGLQQGKMRDAAILAGIIPDAPDGHARVHFVSEGEASLHYCIDTGLTNEFEDGTCAMIIDAGGGTVDVSSYCFKTLSPVKVEETAAAECVLQGSTRVNERAKQFFRARFANSKFRDDLAIKAMLEYFEKTTKPSFKNPAEKAFVKFGGFSDRDPKVGVKNGQFSVEGAELAKLFDPSINDIVEGVRKQKDATTETISHAFLVGGFAASTYLFTRLQALLKPLGISISRPDHHANKAVAAGAASFFLESYVTARAARFTIGTETIVPYDDDEAEHRAREEKMHPTPAGFFALPDAFVSLIIKGSRLQDGEEISKTFMRQNIDPDMFKTVSKEITCYRGSRKDPQWMDTEPDSFTTLCTVEADTSRVKTIMRPGIFGMPVFLQKFDVVLSCGKTEMTAFLRWEEDGAVKRGPAKIVYDDDTQIAR